MDIEYEQVMHMKSISYLRARDPSILAWNYKLSNVKRNLDSQLLQSSPSSSSTTKEEEHLQVYLRIKKCEDFKELYTIVDDNTLLCTVPAGAQCIRNVRDGTSVTKTFQFSNIFGPQSVQIDLFNGVVKEKVLRFINGHNCSLLTYGASGSGKTFTIVGTADEPGIIPRALEYFFRTLPKLPEQSRIKPTAAGGIVHLTETNCELEKNLRQSLLKGTNINMDRAQHTRTYKAMQQRLSEEPVALIIDDISDVSLGVWVSFAEIHNEFVYDLLKPETVRGRPRQKLRLGHCNGYAYIKDLTCINVSSGLQAYHILQYGLHNLNYAATSLNDHSSRSHSIFTIKLVQTSNTQAAGSVSLFNFCDLAGSERLKKTNNVGERLKESNNINTSLLVLGRCVSLVRESQKHNDQRLIPFRESKLTQLFQKALLGNEAISMIVGINPTREMFDESQHVLNFSAIAKDVIIEQQKLIKHPSNNRFSHYMENKNLNLTATLEESHLLELQEQVAMLYAELQQQKSDSQCDRDHIISTYKKLLTNTNQFWENRCQELENKKVKVIHSSTEVDEQMQQTKRRKLSVVVLDSSTEEEEEEKEKEEGYKRHKSKCTSAIKNEKSSNLDDDFANIQGELAKAKMEIQTKTVEMQKLVGENKLLKATLIDAKEMYSDLQSQFENESKELNLEVIRKQDKINELNVLTDALRRDRDRAIEYCLNDNEDQENEAPVNFNQ